MKSCGDATRAGPPQQAARPAKTTPTPFEDFAGEPAREHAVV
jgi:hypothetical protein